MKKTISILATIISLQFSFYQTGSQVLLTIDTNKITKDEFLRIYNKNSNIETGDKKTVDEYLDLFINYKLKVIEAEKLGYDTVSSFIKELSGYQDQLSKPYLENNKVFDDFTKAAYQRLTKEVNACHILISLGKDPSPKDTLLAYNKAISIRKRILAGEPFGEVAKATSDDPTAKQNGGSLGWFTAFQMVYPFETACYNLPIGQLSMPVRTVFGYHILKVIDSRPNRGEVLVYHIMAHFSQKDTEAEKQAAKAKIDKAYAELQNGEKWENVVAKYSDHKASISKGGKIGWVKAGIVPDDFLDACFSIDSGKYSKPFLSMYGYHIVKVEGRKPIPSFDNLKDDYEKKIKSSQFVIDLAQQDLLNNIKKEYGFKKFDANLETLYSLVDSNSLRSGNWNYNIAKNMLNPVFSIGNKQYSQYDLAKFIGEKVFQNRGSKLENVKDKWTNDFINDKLIVYEKEQLPSKNPELKYLLDEYHDGILLFNLTEDKVWKKAVEDTTGLVNFYKQSPEKYRWKTRVQIAKYTYLDSSLLNPLMKLAKKRIKSEASAKQLSGTLCPKDTIPCINITELKFEKGDNAIGDSIKWIPGAYLTSKVKKKYILYYVEKILPEQTKKFEEARGLYTADYQNYLEKQWMQQLRNKYAIHVNNDVLENIRREVDQSKK